MQTEFLSSPTFLSILVLCSPSSTLQNTIGVACKRISNLFNQINNSVLIDSCVIQLVTTSEEVLIYSKLKRLLVWKRAEAATLDSESANCTQHLNHVAKFWFKKIEAKFKILRTICGHYGHQCLSLHSTFSSRSNLVQRSL